MGKLLMAAIALFVMPAVAADSSPKKPYWGRLVRVTMTMVNAHGVRSISAEDAFPGEGKPIRHFDFTCNKDDKSCTAPSLDELYRTDVPKIDIYKCDNYSLCRADDPNCILVCLGSVY
jgi:hypothetical protein